jgi:histone H3/H4
VAYSGGGEEKGSRRRRLDGVGRRALPEPPISRVTRESGRDRRPTRFSNN